MLCSSSSYSMVTIKIYRHRTNDDCRTVGTIEKHKYQGVKEFHMLARVGCCNIMVFSPFKVKVTYYHPLNLWLLGATNGNQGQTVMHL